MHRPRRTLIILPDGDRVEQALLEAAQREGFVDGRGFTTFARVLEWCEPAKALKRRPCPELTARLIVSACAAKLEPGHPFGAWVKEPGFAREVRTAIAQLKSQRATPELLLHAAERLTDSPAKARGRALAQLWKAYEAGLLQLELADREDLMAGAVAVLQSGLPTSFRGFSAITVKHLYDWPPLRLELVTALARACHTEDIEFLLELPRTNDPTVDALTDEAMGSLERAGAEDVGFARGVELAGNPAQQAVIRQLFGSPVHPERRPEGPESNGWAIQAFSTATAIDEQREIARRVRLALEAGAIPDHIAVAFRDLDSDAEAAVAALAEKGIAARTRRGVPLGSTALGRLALDLPRLVEEQFPAEQVAHFLESRYVRATRTESDPLVVFRAAGVKDNLLGAESDKGAYRVRLSLLAERLRGDEGKRCRALLADVEKLMGICAPLAQARTLGEQFSAWAQVVQKLGLLDEVGGGETIDEAAGALARAAEQALAHDQAAAQALEALSDAVAQALKQSRLAKTPASLAAFSRWLLDAAADVNLPARGVRAGAVRVLDARELFGRRLSHVFLGGLIDGRFPSRPVAASLLSESARVALNRSAKRPLFRVRAGEGEERLLTREAEDRLLFAHALCAAPQVTLSYPRLDAEGRNTLASPWLHGLTRQELQLERLPLGAPPPLERVYSERELRLRAGLEALSDAGTRLTRPDDAAPLLGHALGKEPWFRAAEDVARAEIERFNFFEREGLTPGPHSGGLKDRDLLRILEHRLRFDAESPLSVSALKVWGNCNFAGFVEHLLDLKPPELQLEEMGTREKGVFLHAVAEALLPRLHEAGLLGLPPGPESIAKLEPYLEAALDEATEATRARTAHGNPALWQVSRAYARRAVLKVVLGKAALPFKDAEPSEVELRFGSAGAPIEKAVFPAALDGETDVYLRGKIDRIDAGEGVLGVLDYKTSVKDPRDLKKEFLKSEFQLPIYLHVMRQARGEADLQAAWQSFKNGRASKLDKAVDGQLDLDKLLAVDAQTRAALGEDENLGNALHTLLRNLRAGNLGPRPLDCKWCQYERVCRISDRRLSAEDTADVS